MSLKSIVATTCFTLLTLSSFSQTKDDAVIEKQNNTFEKELTFDVESSLKQGQIFRGYSIDTFNKSMDLFEDILENVESNFVKKETYTEEDKKNYFLMVNNDGILRANFAIGDNDLLIDAFSGVKPVLDCNQLCVIHATIAQKNGLPIYPVYAQNHMFLEWVSDDGSGIKFDPRYNDFFEDGVYNEFAGHDLPSPIYLDTLNLITAAASIYTDLAWASHDLDDDVLSLKYINKAISTDSNMFNAYVLKARIFEKTNNNDSAIAVYSKMEELDSLDTRVFKRRGNQYRLVDNLEKAEHDLEKAIDLDPNDLFTRADLGKVYVDMNEPEKVEEIISYLRTKNRSFATQPLISLITYRSEQE